MGQAAPQVAAQTRHASLLRQDCRPLSWARAQPSMFRRPHHSVWNLRFSNRVRVLDPLSATCVRRRRRCCHEACGGSPCRVVCARPTFWDRCLRSVRVRMSPLPPLHLVVMLTTLVLDPHGSPQGHAAHLLVCLCKTAVLIFALLLADVTSRSQTW